MRTRGKTSGKGLEATEPRRRKRSIPRPEVPHFTLESSALSVRNIGTFCRKHRNFPSAISARFISSVRNYHQQPLDIPSATSGYLMKDFATLRIEPPHIAFSTSVSLSFSPGFSPSLFRSPSPEFGVIPSSSPERATPLSRGNHILFRSIAPLFPRSVAPFSGANLRHPRVNTPVSPMNPF